MEAIRYFLKCAVAAFVPILAAGQGQAQQADLDPLFERLKTASSAEAEPIVEEIWSEWARSGSPAMDLLLERGRKALEDGQSDIAIAHYSALIDHAPDFAEAYNARATAFFQEKRYGESLSDLQMVLALNPRHFGALSGLAIIMEELGHDELALKAWREVTAIFPAQEQAIDAIARLSVGVEGRRL